MPHKLAHRDELENHSSHLKQILLSSASAKLLSMFRDGSIATISGIEVKRNWPPTALPNQSLDLFLNPRSWIPTDNDAWRAPLETLVSEAAGNQNIAASCAEIIGHYVIHPAACNLCGDGHAQERKVIINVTERHPGYLRCFWDAAMKLDNDVRDYDRLIRERKNAETAGFFEPQFLSENFPLPPDGLDGEASRVP